MKEKSIHEALDEGIDLLTFSSVVPKQVSIVKALRNVDSIWDCQLPTDANVVSLD